MKMQCYWLAAVALLLATPAFADARDDVGVASSRCSVFADARTWLECYYGAAEPMRAQLGLPAAPQSQTRLVPLPQAGTPQTPAAQTPAAQAPAAAQPATKTSGGGLAWLGRVIGGGHPEGQWQAVQAYHLDSHGLFTIRLDDGTTWRQLASDPSRAHLTQLANYYRALILAGNPTGFSMEIGGGVGLFKVERQR